MSLYIILGDEIGSPAGWVALTQVFRRSTDQQYFPYVDPADKVIQHARTAYQGNNSNNPKALHVRMDYGTE